MTQRVPSEAAATIIALLGSLGEETTSAVERLILAELAVPTGGQLRQARLGLLIEMVSSRDGVIPRSTDYDTLRRQRNATGENWPHSTTLSHHFGGWTGAVTAAMRLMAGESGRRVQHTRTHASERSPTYTRDESLEALYRFWREHRTWPTHSQYVLWSTALRRTARAGGHHDPRLPTPQVLSRLFGNHAAAVTAAQLAVEHGRLPSPNR